MSTYEHFDALEKAFGKDRVQTYADISKYITIHTPCTADVFIEAVTRDDLILAKHIASRHAIPLFVLGGGSNSVFKQDRYHGLVIKNSYMDYHIVEETERYVDILISSGFPVSRLIAQTVEKGYEGFEYHKGLPGTVGGAIYMNSKWTRPLSYFGDNLSFAFLADGSMNPKKVEKGYFRFAYDYSILQNTHEILLEAIFRLKKTDAGVLKQRAEEAFVYRKQTQPFGVLTSGCFFQNISEEDQKRLGLPTASAGALIDQTGLKGYAQGAFVVSPLHANFILNEDKKNARLEDLIQLLSLIKQKVKEKFGVELREEVIFIKNEELRI